LSPSFSGNSGQAGFGSMDRSKFACMLQCHVKSLPYSLRDPGVPCGGEQMPRRSLIAVATVFFVSATANAAGVKLVYEIDKQDVASDSRADRHAALLIKDRLALDGIKDATVSESGGNRVTVALPDDNPKLVARAKRAVSRPGRLEFRILADTAVPEHAKVTELAKAQPDDKKNNEVRDTDKKLVAKWVTIAPSANPSRPQSLVSRRDKAGDQELLALIDDFNVTDDYVKSANSAMGDNGPCIQFMLDERGAKRFGDFTAANLPDPNTGVGRVLAIIIDDELFTSATIRSRITDRGQITGNFTEAEADGLAGILNFAALSIKPMKLTLISESKSE
jgi:preprotein translocase subunit SecD